MLEVKLGNADLLCMMLLLHFCQLDFHRPQRTNQASKLSCFVPTTATTLAIDSA